MVAIATSVQGMENVSSRVAAEVRAAAARANIRIADLAESIGMSRRTLERKVAGERPFTVDEVVAIALTVGCAPSALMPLDGSIAA